VAGFEKVVVGVGGSLVCWRNTDSLDVSSGFVPLDG